MRGGPLGTAFRTSHPANLTRPFDDRVVAIPEDRFGTRLPTPRSDARVRTSSPAVLSDGSVAWAAADNYIAVACARDRRLRLLIEHDPAPVWAIGNVGGPALYGLDDGAFLFMWHEIYEFSATGALVQRAYIEEVPTPPMGTITAPLGYSRECGLALRTGEGIQFWRGDDYSERTVLPRATGRRSEFYPGRAYPTPDCGVVEMLGALATEPLDRIRVRRRRADGSTSFEIIDNIEVDADPAPDSLTLAYVFPLASGRTAMVYDAPAQLVVRDATGAIVLDRAIEAVPRSSRRARR